MAHGLGAVSFTTCVPTLLTPCTCFEYCWNHPFHTDSIRFHSIHFGSFWIWFLETPSYPICMLAARRIRATRCQSATVPGSLVVHMTRDRNLHGRHGIDITWHNRLKLGDAEWASLFQRWQSTTEHRTASGCRTKGIGEFGFGWFGYFMELEHVEPCWTVLNWWVGDAAMPQPWHRNSDSERTSSNKIGQRTETQTGKRIDTGNVCLKVVSRLQRTKQYCSSSRYFKQQQRIVVKQRIGLAASQQRTFIQWTEDCSDRSCQACQPVPALCRLSFFSHHLWKKTQQI